MYNMSQCKKFSPNIFNKAKCSNCFRQKEEHSAEALECNRASRAVARSGYLFVAPDWDFSVPLNRTKRWQRRWFVLYDDGELNYSVDEHPDTVPQGSVDMCKVLEVTGAEQVTGHPHSLALTSPDRVTFIKAASREDARWWLELLAVFPRRHKRNATFPGGRASPSLPQLGRSASPQPPRPRHLSVTGPSPRTNFLTPPLKEERESPTKEEPSRPAWLPGPTLNVPIEPLPLNRNDYVVSSGSPPTRDKLQCDEKFRSRRDWRNERLRDIAAALTDRSPESSLALPSEELLHLKKGWLWLKSGTEWLKRWWVLCGPSLSAFTDQDEQGTPEITIELSTVIGFNETTTDTRYGLQIHWLGPTLTLSAVTAGIRTNWIQALKKAVPDTPESPITPRSLLLSSDEEYKTASEGGRRGSEDWGELPPSPPLLKASSRVKERARARLKLPRSQSRHSTLDSVSTDELDTAKDTTEIELRNALNRQSAEIDDLRKQLYNAITEVQTLESELARLKNIQSESLVREKQTDELLLNFERNECELNQRIKQADDNYLKDTKILQHRLLDAEILVKNSEERCNILMKDLQAKEHLMVCLQEDLHKANNIISKEQDDWKNTYKHLTSFTDLANIRLESDLHTLSHNALIEQCLDVRYRFENAVTEIRAVKRQLRESHIKCDDLELQNAALHKDIEINQQDGDAQLALMASRLQDLTSKLLSAEKQARNLKSKLQDSREKRRSLSLKGKESTSINKEVEDKVTELEAKILAIEKMRSQRKSKRDKGGERSSPVDGRSSPAQRSIRRLRRKSLDSATTSEPMKLLIRLTELESKISSVANSTESLNTLTPSTSESNLKQIDEHDKVGSTFLSVIREKVNECIHQVSLLKHVQTPNMEQVTSLECNLLELRNILGYDNCEANLIASSVNSVVKQFEMLLRDKLSDIAQRKKHLKESGKLDLNAEVCILAEKIAYENILISRIQESFKAPTTTQIQCDRLINKELLETSHLITSLHAKLNKNEITEPPMSKTNVEYLTKTLAKCLISAARGFSKHKRILRKFRCGPILDTLHNKQTLLNSTFNVYKATKLPLLADCLATETLNLNSDTTCRLRPLDSDLIGEVWSTANNTINSELIQSEINHILMRAAQVYEANTSSDHNFFFSFFASERAALELWSDAVEDQLQLEMQKSIKELNEYYHNSLNKMQRQNWRRRVESERVGTTTNNLLNEFADIVAHKALIDARICVLSGEFTKTKNSETESIDEPDFFVTDLLNSNRLSENLSSCELVQINQSLESEFKCMFDSYSDDCRNILDRYNLKEVVEALNNLANEACQMQKSCDFDTSVGVSVIEQIGTWSDVCIQCREIQRCLVTTRNFINSIKEIGSRSKMLENEEERRPLYLGTEYLTQVENLRSAYRRILATNKGHLQQCDVEQLQMLCERVLMAMEHWHRRSLQDLKESHAVELQVLRQEKEQALAEETQATLAALDAMRKAHEAEVQKEVTKFKQDFCRRQQNELLELADRLSVKCLEAAALEEQLGSTTRQLAHAQQHILQLERNPQLSVQN